MNNIKNNTNHYRNTRLASDMLAVAHLQDPLSRTLGLDNWFYSLQISAARMNDHDTFEEAGLAGCVYDLHDENLFTIEQVISLMDTFERVLRIEGLDLTHYQFSIHIEGPDGDWLPPVNGVPFDKILNIINLCPLFHKELVVDEDEVRRIESAADSIIAQVLPLLGVEEEQHLSHAWSMASAEIHRKFLGL